MRLLLAAWPCGCPGPAPSGDAPWCQACRRLSYAQPLSHSGSEPPRWINAPQTPVDGDPDSNVKVHVGSGIVIPDLHVPRKRPSESQAAAESRAQRS